MTAELKHQIERILRWEPSQYWRLQDFATLSQEVMARTNRWVEPPDLLVFWRSGTATPNLLDALAQFADYADWDDFCERNVAGEMVPTKPQFFHKPYWEVPSPWIGWILLGAVLASVAVGALLWWKR